MNKYDPNVAEMQNYLRTLQQGEGNLPPEVVSDGIFGPETKSAVIRYQNNNGLPSTGEVDYETWENIINKYGMRATCGGPAKTILGYRNDEMDMVLPGGSGMSVWFAQVMMLSVGQKYNHFDSVIPDGVNDGDTTEALIHLQSHACTLYTDGTLDISTWNALVNLYNLTL